MGKLTTHVLDTASGTPAQGLRLTLFRLEDGNRTLVYETETHDDGRAPAPLLEGDSMLAMPSRFDLNKCK